jgi:hypothetical protein
MDAEVPAGGYLLDGVGKQRDVTCALDSLGHQALVFGAVAGYPPRQNLAALGNKAAQFVNLFVFYGHGLIYAEITHALFRLTGAFAQEKFLLLQS